MKPQLHRITTCHPSRVGSRRPYAAKRPRGPQVQPPGHEDRMREHAERVEKEMAAKGLV
jgi:hypothetical protein